MSSSGRSQRPISADYSWYEAQQIGLGDDFLAEIGVAIGSIAVAPERHAVIHRGIRRILTKRFPFAMFYVVEDERIAVLAVLHQASDPERWRGRL